MRLLISDALLVVSVSLALMWCLSSAALWSKLPQVSPVSFSPSAGQDKQQSSPCAGRGVPSATGRCLCKGYWTGPRCDVCEFPRFGGGCSWPEESDLPAPAQHTKVRVSFVCGPVGLARRCHRLRQLAEGFGRARVHRWNGTLSGPAADSADLLVLDGHYDGLDRALQSFKRSRPSAAVFAWLSDGEADGALWRSLGVHAVVGPSARWLRRVNAYLPAAVLATPVAPCTARQGKDVNVTLVGDRPWWRGSGGDSAEGADTAADELAGFGLHLWGAGWESRKGWQGPLSADAADEVAQAAFARAKIAVGPVHPDDAPPDASVTAALDAYSCGAVWMTLPGSTAETPLRAEVPLGVYPQNMFDMRVEIDGLLRDGPRRDAVQKHGADAARRHSPAAVSRALLRLHHALTPVG